MATPYYLWKMHGFQVDIASVKGGDVPWDPASKTGDFLTSEAKAFLEDENAVKLTQSTKSLAELLEGKPELEFDALFLPGGHGIVFDGPENKELKQMVERFWNAGKIVSAICHGPAGLLSACDAKGEPLVKGKRITGFTDNEERAVKKENIVPFLLESKLKEMGAEFVKSELGDWTPMAVSDGKLVTGQNPQSSAKCAEAVAIAIAPHLAGPIHGKGEGFHERGHPFAKEHHHVHGNNDNKDLSAAIQ